MQIQGSGVALVTPFDKFGKVDFDSLRKLVQLQIKGGTDFLVVQGTTGETPVLSEHEKSEILEAIIAENNGQLPIFLGVGGNNTQSLCNQLANLKSEHVNGILSVSPYYNKPSQEGIYQHFKALSESTDKSIILYNVPGRTGSNIAVETTLRLTELKNIIAIKEASGNLEQIMSIIQYAPTNFAVLSGDDALTVPMISLGARGVISVVANALPERFSAMVNAALKNDWKNAQAQHYALLELTKLLFVQGNPAGIKSALKERGICKDFLRLPLTNVTPDIDSEIASQMRGLMN